MNPSAFRLIIQRVTSRVRVNVPCFLIVCIVLVASNLCAGNAWGLEPPQTLELREWFGVSHPTQLVEFKLDTPAAGNWQLEDEKGNDVQYQLLDQGKRLALCTDLPAGMTKKWHWLPGRTHQAAAVKQVDSKLIESGLEITNGLVTIRIPSAEAIKNNAAERAQSSLQPLVDLFNYGPPYKRLHTLAPLQGVRLRDGSWSGNGPNTLVVYAKSLTDAHVDLVESGPLKSIVRLRYEFDKPDYVYGRTHVSDAGPGYLNVTITVVANQPSVLFEEETDLDEVWSLNMWDGVEPNQGRYCGHGATDPRFGHLPNGAVYPASHARGAMEAIVDLQFDHPQLPCYVTSKDSWQILPPWNPWVQNSGWYWELYNSHTIHGGNRVGIFAGPTSRILEPAMSGASVFTLPPNPRTGGKPIAGFASQSYRRSADAHIGLKSRFSWGLFVGENDQDSAVTDAVPAINLQMNLFGSPITLTKLAAMKMDYPDLPQGYGGLYMDREALADLITRVRQGKKQRGGGVYGWLYNAEPSSRPLFDAWADESGAKMKAASNDVVHLARDLENELINGRGIHSERFHYWHGGLEMMRYGLWIDQALASGQLSAEERARMKAAASLFAHVLWDNDFVPMDNFSGMNMGTANMPQQQQGYRYFYALFLATHPDFSGRANLVDHNAQIQVAQQINESGAHIGCPHYISASFAPTLNTLMQLQQLGQSSALNTDPRLKKFAEFYLNFLTPPEVRFPGNPRSYIALGDSSTEASPLYGQLGTAFCKIDPLLSRRLMGAWRESGKPHSGFFGTTVLSIDERLPQVDPQLHSATFPGYYSVLRSGYGSTNESAAWVINGNFYSDHRNDDAGNLILYVLGVPLSVHWGSIYSPHAAGAFYHSSILPEAAIGWPWDKDSPPTDVKTEHVWSKASQSDFKAGPMFDTVSSQFEGHNIAWTRTIQLHHENPAEPVIVIDDKFIEKSSSVPKVLTLNLMAKGSVQTPSGAIIPELRTHPYAAKAINNSQQLPSATGVTILPAGVNRLSFTGQFGVDFDLFVIAQDELSMTLGNWAVSWTQQSLPKWEERQDILRLRGKGPFKIVIVPYRSGHRPADLNLRLAAGKLVLVRHGEMRTLGN
jgi:hypothetical protein